MYPCMYSHLSNASPVCRRPIRCHSPNSRCCSWRAKICAWGLFTLLVSTSLSASAGESARTPHAMLASESTLSKDERRDAGTLIEQAERAYRAGDFSRALPLYRKVVQAEPEDAFAWLRIGNLQQRKSAWLPAAVAYRKAATAAARGASPAPRLRAKALLNLASVNLQLARSALTEFDALAAMADQNLSSGTGASGAVSDDAASIAWAQLAKAAREQAGQSAVQLGQMIAHRSQIDHPLNANPLGTSRSIQLDRGYSDGRSE